MSSAGTFRAQEAAWHAFQAAKFNPASTTEELDRLYDAWRAASDIHQDYLQSERDEARAERDEQ